MEANACIYACSFWKCRDGTFPRNSPRPKGAEQINATRRLQLERNSETIGCQLEITGGCGEGDGRQGKRLGPETKEDVDNGGWHYKSGFERKPEGKEAEPTALPWDSRSSRPQREPRRGLAPCPPAGPCPSLRRASPSGPGGPGRGFFCCARLSAETAFRLFWKVT